VSNPVFWLSAPVAPEAIGSGADAGAGHPLVGSSFVLDGPEGRHAVTVRRTRVGEAIDLVDGSGLRLRCVVTSVEVASLAARVESVEHEPEPSPRLVVVQALAKGERSELAVETVTEIGADVVVPWQAARCVVQWRGDRGTKSLSRWQSTALAAAKQSRRARAPEVATLASTADVAQLLAAAALPVVLHESAHVPLSSLQVPTIGDVVVVVGPEGGIAPDELAAFAVEPVRLGGTVLRTSTAGVAACAALLSRTSRWS
jgi:16S rRNA (uracil1498-N3)-methyltransferase